MVVDGLCAFYCGETIESVTEKLKTKGLRLINDEIKYKIS
jgi:hypothetical protein